MIALLTTIKYSSVHEFVCQTRTQPYCRNLRSFTIYKVWFCSRVRNENTNLHHINLNDLLSPKDVSKSSLLRQTRY
jgi:hypothetical protein